MSEENVQPCFVHSRRVEFHETDMAGIVHFSNFFRYMEAAEQAFLRSIGHPLHEKKESGEMGWPRVSASCDYRKPARFGDVLSIRVFVVEIGNRSIRWRFTLHREEDDLLLAEGSVTAACVSFDQESETIRAVPIPNDLRQALETAQPAA